MEAVFYNYDDIVEYLLLQNVEVNTCSKSGITAIWRASLYGYHVIARLLIERGADVRRKNRDGHSPLDVASDDDMKDLLSVRSLISDYR